MLNVPAYVLSKKYTNETAIQFGAVKGAPAKIKSVKKQDGINIITFEWKNDAGETRETIVEVQDGTPIYEYKPGDSYEYGDLIIYEACFYRCITPNSDTSFDPNKWNAIGSPDGKYDMVDKEEDLPSRFTEADRKMYYVVEEAIFYYWDGTEWVPQNPPTISNEDIDKLFI